MGLIPQSFIDDLIERANIVEIIGARVTLKRAGREYRACCPFHNEKTPSFSVSPEKQFYHCFGCGVHGTVLRFLMEHDRLPFVEAVEELAHGLGLEVPREGGVAPPPKRNDSLYDVMGRAAAFYAETLNRADSRGERARHYTEARGLTRETLAHFCIGYAPDSWNDLLRRLGGNDESSRQLAECGLIIEREESRGGERHYDRFRDRIMFPIRDSRGRVIAFGGRILDQGEPKYLNSPETVLFHKGRELYGLYETRQSRAPLQRLLVVEGYMDVVRLHQAGVHYAVATLGTATSADHLKRIFQLVKEVVFCFDGDRAGRAAAWKALNVSLPEAQEGREIRFLFLPEGEDPDTLVGAEGREAFEQRLTAAVPLSEYFVRELGERVMTRGADGRARVAEAARPLLLQVPEGIYRRLLVERLAQAFGFQRTPEGMAELLGMRIDTPGAVSAGPRGAAAGRGSLVRQAVRLLLQFPGIATELPDSMLLDLIRVEEAGVDLLGALLLELRTQPAQHAAQVIERWRGRPGENHLAKLATLESLVPNPPAALRELTEALGRLCQETERKQLDQLLEKDRAEGLTADEKLELQRLMSSVTRGGRHTA